MPVRVLKNRSFARLARKEGLSDRALATAAREIEGGLVDAHLGGSLIKKRIAKGGRGKSGGFRTIVAWRQHDRLVFPYMFAKNERDNINKLERVAFLEIGEEYMNLSLARLDQLIDDGSLIEVPLHDA